MPRRERCAGPWTRWPVPRRCVAGGSIPTASPSRRARTSWQPRWAGHRPRATGRPAKSTFTVSITPFAPDGSLAIEGLRQHFRRLAAADMGVYILGSGSSEAYSLTDDEIDTILSIAVEELRGVVPLRAMG